MARTGFYPGSFDPLTNGHVDIITRAATLLDALVIAVGVHHGKKPLFSIADRVEMLKEHTGAIAEKTGAAITVQTFDNLTVDAARDAGATVLVRGLRDSGDVDYEMRMAGMNLEMAPDIETVFLAASPAVRHVTGTFVRQIASMGGDPSAFVPERVAQRMAARFSRKR